MRRGIFLATACCIVLLLGLCSSAYAGEKVGFINLQRLVNESKLGETARGDFAGLRKKKEEAILQMGREIETMRDEINKAGDKMPSEKKLEKRQEIQRRYKEYKRLVVDSKEDIQQEDRELVGLILKKADEVLKTVAKENGYAIILKDPNAIGYLDQEVDITDKVIKELDNMTKKDPKAKR